MKKNLYHQGDCIGLWPLKTLAVLLFLAFSVSVYAGNKGGKADLKSLNVQLERAQAAYQKNLQKKMMADSLLNLGNSLHEKSGDEIRAAIRTMNTKAKAFTIRLKELEKGKQAGIAADILEVRAAIKELEADYKAALTRFDEIMKEQIKLADDGSRHIHKGKAFNREVKRSLRFSEKSYKKAREALETQTLLSSR